MADINIVLPAKRKRTQISYEEPEIELLEGEDAPACDSNCDDLPCGDTVYGLRNRSRNRKPPTGKRARLTLRRFSRPKKPFRFLDLPQELRDCIYDLMLTQAEGVGIVSRMKGFRRLACRGRVYDSSLNYYEDNVNERQPLNRLVPSLLATCKQIRSEASGYLYKQRIVMQDMVTLHTFLGGIGPSNRLLLSEVVVKHWAEGRGTHKAMNFAGMTSLAPCTHLQKLNLDCVIGYQRTPKQLARQIFRDGHNFLEAFGREQGKKDAAIKILELNHRNFQSCNWDGPRRSYRTSPEPETFKKKFEENLRQLLLE